MWVMVVAVSGLVVFQSENHEYWKASYINCVRIRITVRSHVRGTKK